jgi:hypothetical protein
MLWIINCVQEYEIWYVDVLLLYLKIWSEYYY